ncbi:hypothetical protein BH18ACT14_BH18ACT14_00110 [soil metagenome]
MPLVLRGDGAHVSVLPWCAAPQRLKITELFHPHPAIADSEGRLLRVSRYLGDREDERHLRLSVWEDVGSDRSRAEAAISRDEDEAGRLAAFLHAGEPPPPPPRERYRASRHKRRGTLL